MSLMLQNKTMTKETINNVGNESDKEIGDNVKKLVQNR